MDFGADGYCDDGGPGSIYSNCELGTDCADCGAPRCALPPPLPSPPPPLSPPPLPSLPPPPAFPPPIVPPPSPPPPPFAPPPPGTPGQRYAEVYEVTLALEAAGEVSDFDASTTAAIAGVVAAQAGVDPARVRVAVTAASVHITITIVSQTTAAAAAVSTSMAPAVASAASATALLAPASIAVSSISQPLTTRNSVGLIDAPSLPPSPSPPPPPPPPPPPTPSPPPPSPSNDTFAGASQEQSAPVSETEVSLYIGIGVSALAVISMLVLFLWHHRTPPHVEKIDELDDEELLAQEAELELQRQQRATNQLARRGSVLKLGRVSLALGGRTSTLGRNTSRSSGLALGTGTVLRDSSGGQLSNRGGSTSRQSTVQSFATRCSTMFGRGASAKTSLPGPAALPAPGMRPSMLPPPPKPKKPRRRLSMEGGQTIGRIDDGGGVMLSGSSTRLDLTFGTGREGTTPAPKFVQPHSLPPPGVRPSMASVPAPIEHVGAGIALQPAGGSGRGSGPDSWAPGTYRSGQDSHRASPDSHRGSANSSRGASGQDSHRSGNDSFNKARHGARPAFGLPRPSPAPAFVAPHSLPAPGVRPSLMAPDSHRSSAPDSHRGSAPTYVDPLAGAVDHFERVSSLALASPEARHSLAPHVGLPGVPSLDTFNGWRAMSGAEQVLPPRNKRPPSHQPVLSLRSVLS